ncbi:hypothetical protein Tco_0250633 [Tanacetum coccineum]
MVCALLPWEHFEVHADRVKLSFGDVVKCDHWLISYVNDCVTKDSKLFWGKLERLEMAGLPKLAVQSESLFTDYSRLYFLVQHLRFYVYVGNILSLIKLMILDSFASPGGVQQSQFLVFRRGKTTPHITVLSLAVSWSIKSRRYAPLANTLPLFAIARPTVTLLAANTTRQRDQLLHCCYSSNSVSWCFYFNEQYTGVLLPTPRSGRTLACEGAAICWLELRDEASSASVVKRGEVSLLRTLLECFWNKWESVLVCSVLDRQPVQTGNFPFVTTGTSSSCVSLQECRTQPPLTPYQTASPRSILLAPAVRRCSRGDNPLSTGILASLGREGTAHIADIPGPYQNANCRRW